jgi:hypothetical protein
VAISYSFPTRNNRKGGRHTGAAQPLRPVGRSAIIQPALSLFASIQFAPAANGRFAKRLQIQDASSLVIVFWLWRGFQKVRVNFDTYVLAKFFQGGQRNGHIHNRIDRLVDR